MTERVAIVGAGLTGALLATMLGQRGYGFLLTGTLTTLPELAKAANLRAPTLIIVGEVVTLRDKLRWFAEAGD